MCMIPFDLSSVDSGMVLNNGTSDASSNVSYKPLVVRISDFCKKFLAYPGKEQEAAAVVLARLLTRYVRSCSPLLLFLFAL